MPATENKYPPFQVRESQKEEISTYIKKAHEIEDMYNIPRNMLAGLLYAESNFNPKAVSKVGAQGIAQFMPATAKEVKLKDPFNPIESIEKAGEYLKKQYDKFETWDKALAAYNWGRGNVLNKGLDKAPTETRNYIEKVPYYQQELNKYLGIEETSTEIPTNSNSTQELTLEGLNNEGNIDISEFPFSAQVKDNTNYTVPKVIPQKQIERKDPQFQPQKREGELTTTQFLEQYLQGNEFQDGGLLNLYPDGGKLPKQKKPKRPIYVDDANDPRYQAYKDSLNVYNEGNLNYEKVKEEQNRYKKEYDDKIKWYNILTKPAQIVERDDSEHIPSSRNKYLYQNEELNQKYFGRDDLKPIKIGSYASFSEDNKQKNRNILESKGNTRYALYKKPEQEVIVNKSKSNKKPEQEVILKNREPNLDTDVVAYLQSQGQPHSYSERKKMFNERFPDEDYKGTSEQNINLLNSIKTGETPQTSQFVKNIESSTIRENKAPDRLHFQYGYYDNSGKFVRKDYKHNEQGKREFEEAKNKSGFRIINPDNLTKNSGYKPSEDRFNYNPNEFAFGGYTGNEMKNTENILTEFNEGGSHEQNPLGGIPQGQDEQGVPNKVEEGEVKINLGQDNYILPIRNGEMVTKEILQQFNLPTKYAGKPLADIAKKLTAQYKESNNFIDKETAKEELEKLKAINEVFLAEKKRQEQMNPDNGLNIDMLEEGSNEFFLGGDMDNEDIGGLAGIAGAGLTALTANKPSAAGGAASGALSGVSTGAALGAPGMIAGGAIGALTGGIFGNKAKKAQEELADKKFNAMSNQYRQYGNGGNMKTKKDNFYPNGGWITKAFDSINSFTDGLNIDLGANLTTPGVTREQAERRPIQSSINAGLTKYTPGYTPPKADLSGSASSSDEDEKKSSIFGNIKDTAIGAMRYASPLNNLLQLSQMEKPTFEPSNKIDKRYEPSLFDEQSITNLVRESAGNTRRALHESSGGDAGALSSNLIASQLAETKGLSSAMMQGQDINRQEKAREQEFNLGVDQLNTQIDMADKEGFRRDKGAYSSNKLRLQSALATDLSNISLEEMRKKYPEMMGLSYSWDGDFFVGTDKNGNIISRIHGDNVPKKE